MKSNISISQSGLTGISGAIWIAVSIYTLVFLLWGAFSSPWHPDIGESWLYFLVRIGAWLGIMFAALENILHGWSALNFELFENDYLSACLMPGIVATLSVLNITTGIADDSWVGSVVMKTLFLVCIVSILFLHIDKSRYQQTISTRLEGF